MNPKITLIGAGSVVFAKTLISDVLQLPELSNATISLMDIDPARLKVAEIMAKKIVAKLKVGAKVEATLDQRKAIRGANYVICTVQVGGYKPGTVIDFEIPRKYGLLQTIGDTLGVGGVFRGLRTIPVVNSIARDIADVGASNCILLNYSNPMAMNCWGVDRAVGIPHVGLCHSVFGTARMLAGFAKLPYKDVSYLVAGINHMAFFLKFNYKDQDAYPLLFRLLQDSNHKGEKVRMEMMRRTGYFVTESSEHQSEYVPYFIHHGEGIIKKFDIPIDEYLRRCEQIIGSWRQAEAELLGKDGEINIHPRSEEYGTYIIHSRETNTPRVIYGNVPNRDLISNLPQGCCVEVPCLVDAAGIQPTRIGDLPPQLASLCRTNINVQELTVEAALTNKREHIYHAVMLDPHAATVLTLDKVWEMCDELIAAHQKHGLLKDFAPVIRNTGRGYKGTGDRGIARLEFRGEEKDATRLALVVENPGSETLKAKISVACTTPSARISGPKSFLVNVAAGRKIEHKVRVVRQSTAPAAFDVELTSSTPQVFTTDFKSHNNALEKTEDGGAAFEMKLSGFPAVAGIIRDMNKNLHFTIEVNDSKITTNPTHPWEGSSVELFFADPIKTVPTQVFCIPKNGKGSPRVLDRSLRPIRGAQVRQSSTAEGYKLSLTIPKKALSLPQRSARFLFHAHSTLTALGTAHSGGRTSLSGEFDSSENSSHYSKVELNR